MRSLTYANKAQVSRLKNTTLFSLVLTRRAFGQTTFYSSTLLAIAAYNAADPQTFTSQLLVLIKAVQQRFKERLDVARTSIHATAT